MKSAKVESGLKVTKPTVTIKARWAEGDTETIRTINVRLSEENSTAIVRLEPIRSVELTDGKDHNAIQIGDSKSDREFSLMQFELMPDNFIKVKCWAEKPQRVDATSTDTKPLFPEGNAARAKITTGKSEAKADSGVTIETTSPAPASAAAPAAGDASASAPSATDAKASETPKKP